MYTVGITHERTTDEYKDPFLAWKRDDVSFFAAGACHILAYMFLSLHNDEECELIHIKPASHNRGNHMYVVIGDWAFDFNGWTREKELLAEYEKAYRELYDEWEFNRVVVTEKFTDYIAKNNHTPPEYFPYLPWERAYNYIKKFEDEPPM